MVINGGIQYLPAKRYRRLRSSTFASTFVRSFAPTLPANGDCLDRFSHERTVEETHCPPLIEEVLVDVDDPAGELILTLLISVV